MLSVSQQFAPHQLLLNLVQKNIGRDRLYLLRQAQALVGDGCARSRWRGEGGATGQQ